MKFLKSSEMDLTTGSIAKKMILFAIPVILSGWLQLLYSAADLITCGNFGSHNSVGAISATSSLISLIVSLFIGLSVGSNVLMSMAFGAKQHERAERIIGNSYAIAIISGLILAIIGTTCSRYFLIWMGTPDEILDLANVYMTIYFAGIPFTIIYDFGSALMRGLGDTTKPFIFLAISGAINVGLNFLFVITFKMDVAGVATTTVIAQVISAFLVTFSLIKNEHGFACLRWKYLRFRKEETIQILKIGIPSGIQSALFSLSNVVLQSSINSFGADAVTGTGAESSIESFLSTAVDGLSQGAVAFAGANYGAKNVRRIKQSALWSTIDGIIVAGVLGIIVYFIPEPLLRIYISDPDAISYGVEKLKLIGETYTIYAVVCTVSSAIRGLGYSITPMIISLLGICVLRIAYIYTIFPLPEFHTITGLYYSYPLSWIVTAVAHIICYFLISRREFRKLEQDKSVKA